MWVDAFELATCQVTNADYAQFLEAAGHPQPLHWDDSKFNCRNSRWWRHRGSMRLRIAPGSRASPRGTTVCRREAEWERAARGGVEGKAYPWGDEPPESLLDYHLRWWTGPDPVGRGLPNPYGLYEMCENVHEWCADWYGRNIIPQPREKNPKGPVEGTRRASRGGSWRHYIKVSRCAARSSIPPGFQYADYGFRVARDIADSSK